MNQASAAKLKLVVSMFIFGTIGVFVRHLTLPSSVTALVRGTVGMAFLLAVLRIRKTPMDKAAIGKNRKWLCLSGGCLGFNWILLFESYRYTSVAVSTLCYYMAPILVLLASPLVLKEKLTAKKLLCVAAALAGMVCISGVLHGGLPAAGEGKGILLGLAAAVLYAGIMLANQRIRGIGAYDKTIVQLGVSALVLLPYCLLTVEWRALTVSWTGIGLLLLVGVVHTGLTYFLYFGSMEHVSGQTVAIISYVDPVVAVLASVLILREPMQAAEGLGALLILGAALVSEIHPKRKQVQT